ncbi:MAG: serine O-acetyltransferase [Gammaproteobacteria bacterium]|nr:MAG: serine O-acetyltransferase [Gammaproteobacteria bacterium]
MFDRVKEDIASVYNRDPAARNFWDVLITYPGLHGIWIYRFTHKLWVRGWFLTAKIISTIARFMTGIEIHPGAKIGRRFFIDHGHGVVIGETAVIGDDVTLYHGVTLGGTSWDGGKRHPTLEDNVVIGAGAKILGPITIAKNARVGSNAVVVRNVDEEVTVIGIPARIVSRKRNSNKFDAYSSRNTQRDPVRNALDIIVEHCQILDEKIKKLAQAMPDEAIKDCCEDLPELDLNTLHDVLGSYQEDIDNMTFTEQETPIEKP